MIDDESDYFSVDDRWLSSKERDKLRKREEELRDKRHGSRLDRKITLDFAGRRVIEVFEYLSTTCISFICVTDEELWTPCQPNISVWLNSLDTSL